jgi:tetratricopeptide (TPR) repeat protein
MTDQPWTLALEMMSVRTWDKAERKLAPADSLSVSELLPEAVFWSVVKTGESPPASDFIAIPDLAPYLKAMEEEPNGLKALAALNVAENLCASHDRSDVAGLIEVTITLRHRSTKLGQAAGHRLADRFKSRLPTDDAEKLSAAVKALLETGSDETAHVIIEFAARAPDSDIIGDLNSILFASLPSTSEARKEAGIFLANRAAAGGLSNWLESRGEKKTAARMRLELVGFVEDRLTVARLWQNLADNLTSEKDDRPAAAFCLAAADLKDDPEAKKILREKAVALLSRAGQAQAALDLCSRLIGPDASDQALRELLGKDRAQAQEELPVLKARILRSPNTEVGCQALGRALRFAPIMSSAVDDLCREVVVSAPESKAAVIILLAKSEQLCRQGSVADALTLLERLPEERIPADLRAQLFERFGDCRLAQGRCRDAVEAYRSAAKECYYEYELGGFGFFGLKKHSLSPNASVEDQRVEAECLKGYLELAAGRTCEGIARLERILVALRRLSADSEIRRLRLSDAHFLLAVAWIEEGAIDFGTAEGHAAIKVISREPEQRAGLFAFAQMLSACASAEQTARSVPSPAQAQQGAQSALSKAAGAAQQGNYVEARATYKQILDSLKGHDTKIVLETCNGMLDCLAKEHRAEGFDTVQAQFQEWAARSVPEGYEGCPTLAVARACYQRSDFQGAAERTETCLAVGDAYLATQAHMLDGLIKFRSGRMAEALPCFEEALVRTAPDDPAGAEALFFVGYINMVNGNADQTQKSFEALVKRYPGTNYAVKCRDLLDRLKTDETKASTAVSGTRGP